MKVRYECPYCKRKWRDGFQVRDCMNVNPPRRQHQERRQQQQQERRRKHLQGLNFGSSSSTNPAVATFPNPFGLTGALGDYNFGHGGMMMQPQMSGLANQQQQAPPPSHCPSFPQSPSYLIPNNTNALADLSLGKVMDMMGEASSTTSSGGVSKPSQAPELPQLSSADLDDLLGLE